MSGKRGRVFVVQQPAYYDAARRGWVNKYDLSPATEHGELVYLLGPSNIYRSKIEDAVRLVGEKLSDFTEADHLLAVGDPIAISIAVLVAGGRTGGTVSMLKWDRHEGTYEPYIVRVPDNSGS